MSLKKQIKEFRLDKNTVLLHCHAMNARDAGVSSEYGRKLDEAHDLPGPFVRRDYIRKF